jgi:hypothetical protein
MVGSVCFVSQIFFSEAQYISVLQNVVSSKVVAVVKQGADV